MSIENIYNDIKNKLLSIRSDIVVNPGSVTSDVYLTPQAFVLNKNRVLLEYVKTLQTLFTIEALLNNENAIQEIANIELKTVNEVRTDIANFIDKFADNYDLSRNPAEFATGTVFFGRIDPPSSNITIPEGTKIKTLDNKIYTTTEEVIMETPGTDLYDPESNLYVVEVNVKATEGGVIGNTTSGTITEFIDNVSGLNYVFNKDNFTSGYDEEDNTSFIARIRNQLSGNNVGTIDGYKRIILNNFRDVKDILIVGPGNELMKRDSGFGGAIDIWILEETLPERVTETATEFNLPDNPKDGYIFSNQPVSEIILAPETYQILKDDSELAHSYAAQDAVEFDTTPALSFDVTYTYYPLIQDIQEFLQQDKYAVLGNTIKKANAVEDMALVKKAIERLINISAIITILPNFNINTVIINTRNNILNYVAELKLGESLSQSDIVNIIENTEGVNYVELPFEVFNFMNEAGISDTLTVKNNEYIRINDVNINV